MIDRGEIYQVVAAMVPLYFALGLGYASVKWWRMFQPDHCNSINRFNCYFIIPFFVLRFISGVDPYHLNFRFLAADTVAKASAAAALVAWAKLSSGGNFAWAVTSFSLSCFGNTLVVGVPFLRAVYGADGEDLVVQASVLQFLLWTPCLLFMYEIRRSSQPPPPQPQQQFCSVEVVAEDATETDITTPPPPSPPLSSPHFGSTMKTVGAKLAKNPTCDACLLGIIWALIAKRWNLKMPSIVEGSLVIMAEGGSGVAMFTIGQFMALNDKIIACGLKLCIYCLVMRFVVGPLTSVVAGLALGLRSTILDIAILQAALPQAIISFVFAQEYGLHAETLSTAVIFGTIISLPLMIVYYVVLEAVN